MRVIGDYYFLEMKQKDNLEKKYLGSNPFGVQSKLLFHINRLNDYVKRDETTPIEMEINLTSRCNLNCAWCISENMRANDELDVKYVKKFLKQYKEMGGMSIILSGGGEPTMHTHFKDIVNYAYELGINLGLMTNGVYPESYNDVIGEKFHWVRFSLDTLDREKFKKWKGVDRVDTIIGNIKMLKSKPTRVWVNSNVSHELTLKEAKDLVEQIPKIADGLQFRPLLPRYFKEEKIKINHEVWEYLTKLENTEKISLSEDKLNDLKNEQFFPFNHCDGHFLVPILNSNGDVCICMYQTNDSRFVFGNIHEKDFKDIWNSKRRRGVIDFVRGFNYANNCQICCKLTEINKFLNFIKYSEKPRDVNFL